MSGQIGDPVSELTSWAAEGQLQAVIAAAVVIVCTAIVARLCSSALRRLLKQEDNPLPANSIFINIVRAAIWVLGICLMLSACFGVDVTAGIAALGVGGIAVSLGFKDTISNLIGGVQVSLMGIVAKGDNISVGSESGVVQDVTWRQTEIKNSDGRTIVIPNAVMNSVAVEKLWDPAVVRMHITVRTAGRDIDEVAGEIESKALSAALGAGDVAEKPKLLFTEIGDFGTKALLKFTMADAGCTTAATDQVIRAIAPLTSSGALSGEDAGAPAR